MPPESISLYGMKHASDTFAELAKSIQATRIILGGHDWGVSWKSRNDQPFELTFTGCPRVPLCAVGKSTFLHCRWETGLILDKLAGSDHTVPGLSSRNVEVSSFPREDSR